MALILIIDDEESLRFTFKSFLAREGYQVVTSENYESALAVLDHQKPDLIFADIILPGGKTGLDLLKEIQKRGMTCPVIIITGQPDQKTSDLAITQGAFDYIHKPVRKENLLKLTKRALDSPKDLS